MFNYDEAANCPKIRRTSFQLKGNFYLKYAMKTPSARKVSAMLTMLLPEMFALSTLALEQKLWQKRVAVHPVRKSTSVEIS